MCTLSWLFTPTGCEIFFNRDEQRTRERALPLRALNNAAYPVDPQGGGTWIGANANGLAFALLNFYQGCMPKDKHGKATKLVSRGRIITQLVKCDSLASVKTTFEVLDLTQFAPFSLCVFTPISQVLWQWTGQKLHVDPTITSPMTSSSVHFEEVKASRLYHYAQLPVMSSSSLFAFHTQHQPDKNHKSVCMHRDDAQSVSFTHIQLQSEQAIMRYHNSSPCALSDYSALLALEPVVLARAAIEHAVG